MCFGSQEENKARQDQEDIYEQGQEDKNKSLCNLQGSIKEEKGEKIIMANQKAKFKKAAKKCKGQKIKAFRACMRRELKKK